MADLKIIYCPRCDKGYTGPNEETLLERVKKHVSEQHPDHDPMWWDTHAKDHKGEE